MIKTKIYQALSLALVGLSLTGCVTIANNSEKIIYANKDKMDSGIKKGNSLSPNATSVTTLQEIYIAGDPYQVSEDKMLPEIFNRPYVFQKLDPVSFTEIISQISKDLGIRIDITSEAIDYIEDIGEESSSDDGTEGVINTTPMGQSGMTPEVQAFMFDELNFSGSGLVGSDVLFTLDHSGTVKSIMDSITSKANVYWEWDKDHIEIFRLKTETFVFDGENSSSAFSAGVNSAQNSGDDGTSTSSSNNTTVTSAPPSLFDDLESSIKAILSDDGRYSISRSLGHVTVSDTPSNLIRIKRVIDEMNQFVNKQIAMRVEVYEISSDNNGEFGIDWNAIFSGSSNVSFGLNSTFTAAASNMQLGIINPASNWVNTEAFVKTLNEYADMSLVTSSSVFTSNGQPVPVQVADEINYISNMSSTNDGEGNISYSMETGTVISGFTMSVEPRINSKGDVKMRFAVDMSQLNDIVEKSVGEGDNLLLAQLPDRTSKNFIQNVTVGSGQTMMIAGFERSENSSKTSSLAEKSMWMIGGSRSGADRKVMTMILLTPFVMSNH